MRSSSQAPPAQLRTRFKPRKVDLSVSIGSWTDDCLSGFDLPCRQAIGTIIARTLEVLEVNVAGFGVPDQPVFHSVVRIASIEYSLMNHWIFA